MLAPTPSVEVAAPSVSLLAQVAALPDPRVDRTKRHSLTDVLAIALLATLSGADTYTQFALFGVTRQAWLATFLALPNGIPSHDTFARVLRALDPKAFAAWLTTWSQALAGTVPGVVAIDGKTRAPQWRCHHAGAAHRQCLGDRSTPDARPGGHGREIE